MFPTKSEREVSGPQKMPQSLHATVLQAQYLHRPARQATFNFGNKYRQMESSDVVVKISRVLTGRHIDCPR
jgi:hypothetical protein